MKLLLVRVGKYIKKIKVMTQEQKELLLKDLCSRLPYVVKVQSYSYGEDAETIETLYEIDSDGYISTLECETLKNITKPYLFPLSSMTEEQQIDLTKFVANGISGENIVYDWYNKNHFDYRGLIPMRLAIDATNKNIY
jgi:hypothetical protein